MSAFFAFLGKFFQFRNYQRKKLHDDECVDERNDTQSKQRALAHASARNRAQHAQKSFARQAGNNARIEAGQRHEATQTIYNEQRQRSVNFTLISLEEKAFSRFQTLEHLDFTAYLFDFFDSRWGEFVSSDSQRLGEFAVAEHLQTVRHSLAHDAAFVQHVEFNDRVCLEAV